jgi:hypothetical protein
LVGRSFIRRAAALRFRTCASLTLVLCARAALVCMLVLSSTYFQKQFVDYQGRYLSPFP